MARKKEEIPQSVQSTSQSANKRAIWTILIILGFIAVIAIIVIAGQISFTGNVVNEGNQPAQTQKVCRDVQVSYEDQEQYMKTEYYTETVPYTDRECENKEIPYSIDNFVMDYNQCNNEKKDCKTGFLGVPYDCITYCIDKSISCSLTLKNLDNEAQGSWTIKFLFYQSGTNTEIKSNDISMYLYPQTSKVFTGTVRIQSSGVDGDANKAITCNYHRTTLPTKQVCRDVTKYQDIQRERQVTAYRPVTKYKTEQQCN